MATQPKVLVKDKSAEPFRPGPPELLKVNYIRLELTPYIQTKDIWINLDVLFYTGETSSENNFFLSADGQPLPDRYLHWESLIEKDKEYDLSEFRNSITEYLPHFSFDWQVEGLGFRAVPGSDYVYTFRVEDHVPQKWISLSEWINSEGLREKYPDAFDLKNLEAGPFNPNRDKLKEL